MRWLGGGEKGLIKTLESNLVLKVNGRHKELKGRERRGGFPEVEFSLAKVVQKREGFFFLKGKESSNKPRTNLN